MFRSFSNPLSFEALSKQHFRSTRHWELTGAFLKLVPSSPVSHLSELKQNVSEWKSVSPVGPPQNLFKVLSKIRETRNFFWVMRLKVSLPDTLGFENGAKLAKNLIWWVMDGFLEFFSPYSQTFCVFVVSYRRRSSGIQSAAFTGKNFSLWTLHSWNGSKSTTCKRVFGLVKSGDRVPSSGNFAKGIKNYWSSFC